MVDERAPEMDPEAMGGGSHVGALRGLLASGLDALRTRLDLAAVEIEIYLIRFVQMILWAIAAVACALLGLVFGLVTVVVSLWDTHRMLGLLGGTGLFFVLAVLFALIATRTFKGKPTVLEGSLQQLERMITGSAKGAP